MCIFYTTQYQSYLVSYSSRLFFLKISEMKKAYKTQSQEQIIGLYEYVLSMIDERTMCHVTEGMCYTINQEQATRP